MGIIANPLILLSLVVSTGTFSYCGTKMGEFNPGPETYNRCSSDLLYTLMATVKTLKWSNIVIFHEGVDRMAVSMLLYQFETELSGFTVINYDVSNLNDFQLNDILSKVCRQKIYKVNIVVVLRNSTLRLLELANTYDAHSNKTSDFQTKSFWIILCFSESLHRFENMSLNLNNVMLFICNGAFVKVVTLRDSKMEHIRCVDVGAGYLNESFQNMKKCAAQAEFYPNSKYKFNRRHLRLGTMESNMIKRIRDRHGNLVYAGFLRDLTDILAEGLNFTYTFVQPRDQKYGGKKNGEWQGLIGLLHRREVDMVVADLTITEERQEAVDFIFPPFRQDTVGALFKRNSSLESYWLKVFTPLHLYIYCCIFGCIVLVAVLLFILDWETRELGGDYHHLSHLITSLIGFISVRGVGIWPLRTSSRFLVASFWMLCIVVSGVYVGNLTAKLTETREKPPFKNFGELLTRNDWRWGITGGSLIQDIMRKSEAPEFRKLWQKIVEFNKTDSTILHTDRDFHVEKVLRSENYAFVVTQSKLYVMGRNDCALDTVSAVGDMSIALAVTKNSYLKTDLETIMWSLFDNGFFDVLQKKHTYDNRPASCKNRQGSLRPMKQEDMLGSVLIICVGLSLALLTFCVEVIIKKHKKTGETL